MQFAKPLIGVTCDRSNEAPHHLHQVGEKYVKAIVDGAEGIPVVLPALADRLDIEGVLNRLDGLLVTGAYSMLEPHHYNGPEAPAGTLTDPARDATTLALIRAALKKGLPVLCICRGFQELNVVFGGTLEQKVHEQPNFMDHREDKSSSFDVQYAPVHALHIEAGGILAELNGGQSVIVNSVHEQGIGILGKGLRVEGRTDDGLIEAISVENYAGFCLGVQFHPEYKVLENTFYTGIFHLFRDACHAYGSSK